MRFLLILTLLIPFSRCFSQEQILIEVPFEDSTKIPVTIFTTDYDYPRPYFIAGIGGGFGFHAGGYFEHSIGRDENIRITPTVTFPDYGGSSYNGFDLCADYEHRFRIGTLTHPRKIVLDSKYDSLRHRYSKYTARLPVAHSYYFIPYLHAEVTYWHEEVHRNPDISNILAQQIGVGAFFSFNRYLKYATYTDSQSGAMTKFGQWKIGGHILMPLHAFANFNDEFQSFRPDSISGYLVKSFPGVSDTSNTGKSRRFVGFRIGFERYMLYTEKLCMNYYGYLESTPYYNRGSTSNMVVDGWRNASVVLGVRYTLMNTKKQKRGRDRGL